VCYGAEKHFSDSLVEAVGKVSKTQTVCYNPFAIARYKYFDKSRGLFMTVSLEEQLIPGSFEHTLNYLIDRSDLSAFDAIFITTGRALPPVPPTSYSK
jgi:hypothetical protein